MTVEINLPERAHAPGRLIGRVGPSWRRPLTRRCGIAALVILLGVAMASEARATEWMYCHDARAKVSVGLLMGHADTVSVAAVTLEAPRAKFTTSPVYGKGKIFSIRYVRGMTSDAKIGVDFVAAPGNRPVGELRLRRGKHDGMVVYRGTLSLAGKGSWTVSCDEE